jgi:hypothetical protein
MKTMRFIAPIAALVILSALALNSCSNGFDLPEEAASASQEFGTVRVSVGLGQAQDAARTAKPTTFPSALSAFPHLVYTVSQYPVSQGNNTFPPQTDDGNFTLKAGEVLDKVC